MILNEIKKELRSAKNLTVTSKYIIVYRGASTSICNNGVIYYYE